MRNFVSILAFSIACYACSFGQANDDYTKTLKEMFRVSGSEEVYQATIKEMFVFLKQQNTNVDANVWTELENEFSETSIDDLVKMLTPVYMKYMTQKDLKKLIKFYQTPIGQKLTRTNPLMMQESMQIGQQWAKKVVEETKKKLQEKGY